MFALVFSTVLISRPLRLVTISTESAGSLDIEHTVQSNPGLILKPCYSDPYILILQHVWGDAVPSYLYLMQAASQVITKGIFSYNYMQIVKHYSTHIYLCLLQRRSRRKPQSAQVSRIMTVGSESRQRALRWLYLSACCADYY